MVTIPSLYNSGGVWAKLVLCDSSKGQIVYRMRRYDPRLLQVLGRTYRFREIEPLTLRERLVEADLLLSKMVVEDEDQQLALKTTTINAARQVLALARPTLAHADEFISDPSSFDAWKKLFIYALDHFESALSVDIEAQPIVLLEPKRGYAVETLLVNIEDTLPEDDRVGLSPFARANMQEAGACLIYHRFTACGYHMARAVEDVARRYYETVKGQPQKMDNGRDRTLAQIAGEFEDVLKNWKGDPPGLLGLITPTLRNFCRIYRDPLAHADPVLETLDPSQAEVAFGHGISVISLMLEDVRIGGRHFVGQADWPNCFNKVS